MTGTPRHRTAAPRRNFSRMRAWVFDLDNTLYPATCNLFALSEERMNRFIMEKLGVDRRRALRLREIYYRRYGTTLSGLMQQHGVDPEPFLDYVHDIDYAPVQSAPALDAALGRLPGRKFIFTNASKKHAVAVANRLGVLNHFESVFDISACNYLPKPQAAAYHRFLEAHGVDPEEAAMFDDLPRNLVAPHALGMTTVLVRGPCPTPALAEARLAKHIDYATEDLAAFLAPLGAPDTALNEPRAAHA